MLRYFKPQRINSPKVRLGPPGDGGYVMSQVVLENCTALFTYGVGSEKRFEDGFTSTYRKPAYLFDHTVKQQDWDKLKANGQYFTSEGLGSRQSKKLAQEIFGQIKGRKEEIYNVLENLFAVNDKLNAIRAGELLKGIADAAQKIVEALSVKTPREHYDELKIKGDILLKIDTEGAEFDYFNDADIDDLSTFVAGILLEVHWLEIPENQANVIKLMEKLSKHFILVHTHGNNWAKLIDYEGFKVPSVYELSFVNRKYLSLAECVPDTQDYPVPGLDFPNNGSRPECDLSFLKSV